ncbi:MAG: HIT domain-containing protein [Alphaproteobacteria bacterium]|nr:HIT domain-containing protein [Alphaproteobacteria bacterium]
MASEGFVLDQRLAQDTAWVCDWELCGVHLMNDRRYPWLVLVPRRMGMVEAFDLSEAEQALLWREVGYAGSWLKQMTGCRKVNVGALGNIVSQLHLHVVARNEGDAAWPGPVWGQGAAQRYDAATLASLAERYGMLLGTGAD